MERVALILLFGLVLVAKAAVLPENTTDNSSSESGEMDQYIGEVQAMCLNRTGSEEVFQELTLDVTMSAMCLMSRFDVDGFSTDIDALNETTRVEFFTKYCPQLSDSLICITPIVTTLRKCIDPEDMEYIDLIVNIIPEAINFICSDHGEFFFLDDNKLTECADNVTEYADKCFDHMSNATDAMDLSNYGEKQCNELSTVRGCFVNELNQCGGQKFVQLIDMFYRPVIKTSPCKNFIKIDPLPEIETNAI